MKEEFDINRGDYDKKVESIRQRKRKLRNIQEPFLVKKIKKELKIEQRGAKRSEKQDLKQYLKDYNSYNKSFSISIMLQKLQTDLDNFFGDSDFTEQDYINSKSLDSWKKLKTKNIKMWKIIIKNMFLFQMIFLINYLN